MMTTTVAIAPMVTATMVISSRSNHIRSHTTLWFLLLKNEVVIPQIAYSSPVNDVLHWEYQDPLQQAVKYSNRMDSNEINYSNRMQQVYRTYLSKLIHKVCFPSGSQIMPV